MVPYVFMMSFARSPSFGLHGQLAVNLSGPRIRTSSSGQSLGTWLSLSKDLICLYERSISVPSTHAGSLVETMASDSEEEQNLLPFQKPHVVSDAINQRCQRDQLNCRLEGVQGVGGVRWWRPTFRLPTAPPRMYPPTSLSLSQKS